MNHLAIVGAGGHGRVVADAAAEAGWKLLTFFDASWPERTANGAWTIAGTPHALRASLVSYDGVIVAIGDCSQRLALHRELEAQGASLISVVHPRAWVSRYATIGAGSVLLAGAVVNVGASLGVACIVNTAATVDHDCQIDDAVHIAPGANVSGATNIGSRSWIGVGACVRQGIRIGADVLVGAGAVVVADVPDALTVIGAPARPLQRAALL